MKLAAPNKSGKVTQRATAEVTRHGLQCQLSMLVKAIADLIQHIGTKYPVVGLILSAISGGIGIGYWKLWPDSLHRFGWLTECAGVVELVGGRLLGLHALPRRAELPRPRQQRRASQKGPVGAMESGSDGVN